MEKIRTPDDVLLIKAVVKSLYGAMSNACDADSVKYRTAGSSPASSEAPDTRHSGAQGNSTLLESLTGTVPSEVLGSVAHDVVNVGVGLPRTVRNDRCMHLCRGRGTVTIDEDRVIGMQKVAMVADRRALCVSIA